MLLSILSSTEFYVTIFVFAAAIVAFFAKPAPNTPVREMFAAGILVTTDSDARQPAVSLEVLPSGTIIIMRSGLENICMTTDSVSLALKIKNNDITITERIYQPDHNKTYSKEETASGAIFSIETLPTGKYHIRYDSPSTQLSATYALNIRPGIKTKKPLSN